MVVVRDTYLGAKGGRYIYVLKPTKSMPNDMPNNTWT